MANTNIYDLVDTWTVLVTHYDAFKFNITDTLSNATSTLINMQVDSNIKFKVGKRGDIYANVVLSSAEDYKALWLDVVWDTTANTGALLVNITDTASGANTKVFDFKVDAASVSSLNPAGQLTLAENILSAATDFMHETSADLADGAAAGAGTLTNAPTAGDPAKWVAINDNGTTRYFPTWT